MPEHRESDPVEVARVQYEPIGVQLDHPFWLSALGGIVVAAMCYPIFVGAIHAVWDSCNYRLPAPDEIAELLLISIAGISFGGVMGAVIGLITGAIAIVIVSLINKSLGHPLAASALATACGGLAGYLSTSWVVFENLGSSDLIWVGMLGPVMATVMGSIGAHWGTRRHRRLLVHDSHHGFSFSITQILMATLWIALVFAIANAFGDARWLVFFTIAAWFVLQAIVTAGILYFSRLKNRFAAT